MPEMRLFDDGIFRIQYRTDIAAAARHFLSDQFQQEAGDEHKHPHHNGKNADTEQKKQTKNGQNHFQQRVLRFIGA